MEKEEIVISTTHYDCDDKGNVIHSKSDEGDEQWFEYDENNRMIKKVYGEQIREIQYDDNDNDIYWRLSYTNSRKVTETWHTYDENNHLTHIKRKSIGIIEMLHDYDTDVICEYEYDANGNEIYFKESLPNGNVIIEERVKYNEHNKILYYEVDDFKSYYFYDESGRILLYSETRRNKND